MSAPERDPICGMPVDPATACVADPPEGRRLFCSDYCRREYFRRPMERRDLPGEERDALSAPALRRIAYLSMEIALLPGMPTYAGGLGVLAGDALRSCADLQVPLVGLTLLHRRGYFTQRLTPEGEQREESADWTPETRLERLAQRVAVEVEVEGRRVEVAVWRYLLRGATGGAVPVFLLDTDVEPNAAQDRALTGSLYGGDAAYRLAQEVVLGIGGMRVLAALGYTGIQKVHLNEGHAALAALELLRHEAFQRSSEFDFEAVRRRCVFTTHTPVPAGHDQFDYGLVRRVLGEPVLLAVLQMLAGSERMNMTQLALSLSGFVNGVARRHGEVTERMFPGYPVHRITNGVHAATWTCDAFRRHTTGTCPAGARTRPCCGTPCGCLGRS